MSPLALRAMCTSVRGRYAWALFEVAKERKALERTYEDCSLASSLLSSHSPLRLTIASALQGCYPEDWTQRLIEILGFQPFFLSFLRLLADKNRLSTLKDVSRLYKRLADAELNRVSLQVVSADPLTDSQKLALEQHLSGLFCKEMKMIYSIDPRVLGGFIVQSDTITIDVSARHHIDCFIQRAREGFEVTQTRRVL